MTVYELMCKQQSTVCDMAETMCDGLMRNDYRVARSIWQEDIDRAFALGLLIDAMPVELAEREI
jgi:hypothetical protein